MMVKENFEIIPIGIWAREDLYLRAQKSMNLCKCTHVLSRKYNYKLIFISYTGYNYIKKKYTIECLVFSPKKFHNNARIID